MAGVAPAYRLIATAPTNLSLRSSVLNIFRSSTTQTDGCTPSGSPVAECEGMYDDTVYYMRAFSSVVGGTWGRNDVAIRSHTLQKFEQVAARFA